MRKLQNPVLPIDLELVINYLKCQVYYENLYEVSGITFKKFINGQWKYIMYISSNYDDNYSEEQNKFRQRYTIAHEIGHIIMHSHLDWNNIDDNLSDILEVEANWFASRLLMPNYTFNSIDDLNPTILSIKCNVNFQAAHKRIKNLDQYIINFINQQTCNISDISFLITQEYKTENTSVSINISKETKPIIPIITIRKADELFCYKCSNYTEDNLRTFILCDSCGHVLRYE